MSAFTEKNGITRRTALELMTTSAIGLTMMGSTLTVSEAADDLNSSLRKALPKFRDESLALLRRYSKTPPSAEQSPLRTARPSARMRT